MQEDEEDFEVLFKVTDDTEQINEEKEEIVNFFGLFNDISNHGDYLNNYFEINKKLPKEYSSFMMNKAFANFKDTIFEANEMNKLHFLPDEMNWRFFKTLVTKRKRFSKWFKNINDEEPLEQLAKYFECSVKEMQKNINVIPKEKLDELLKELNKDKRNK